MHLLLQILTLMIRGGVPSPLYQQCAAAQKALTEQGGSLKQASSSAVGGVNQHIQSFFHSVITSLTAGFLIRIII